MADGASAVKTRAMLHPNKILIDLDGVLAGPKPANGAYIDCVCNSALVQRLRELKAEGWIIAIHTSRNVKTHNHNQGLLAAHTLPDIKAWLDKNEVPYDEVWLGKPWAGPDGLYVDDRAVRPSELLELTLQQLKERTRAEHFSPADPRGRLPSEQGWGIIDARSGGVTSAVIRTVEQWRASLRIGVILPEDHVFQPGVPEELRRLGARWTRFSKRAPLPQAIAALEQDLRALGELGSSETVVIEVERPKLLKARHFNRVEIKGEHVFKTASTPTEVRKLELEAAWLLKAGEDIALRPYPIKNGYYLDYVPGASLAQALLRQELGVVGRRWVVEELWRLLSALGDIPVRENAYDHDELVINKSNARLEALQIFLMEQFKIMPGYLWLVNGERMGYLSDVVGWLLNTIPPPSPSHIGAWHGDLCPGNMLITHNDYSLRLIDPRGSSDGRTPTFFGDCRYDAGKLCHSLYLGYDSIVEGWRDTAFVRTGNGGIDVRLRLWDEDDGKNQRQLIWKDLEIHNEVTLAMAALQLITCAPLHRDDPNRVLALVARGLQAAREAGCEL